MNDYYANRDWGSAGRTTNSLRCSGGQGWGSPAAMLPASSMPRWNRPEVKPWEPSEAQLFLEAIRGERLQAAYLVALSLGFRRGEVPALRWSDVDFEGKTNTVARALA